MKLELTHLDGQRILRLSSDNNPSKVCITAIHADYIAVSGLKGLNGQSSESLSIWSIPFGTLQGHVKLPTSSDKTTDTKRGSRHLVWLYNHLFCATSATLTCHTCHCENGTLAQALGNLSVDPKDEEEGNVIIKWSTDETETHVSSFNILKTKERVLETILEPNKREKTNAFQKDVQSLQAQSPSAILDILKKVAEDFHRGDKKKPLPGEMIQMIVKTSHLAGSACPEFLSVVLEDANACLVLMCLEHMQDIPEPFVVKCLEFFLSLEESQLSSSLAQNGTKIPPGVSKLCPLGQRQTQCVNRVMSCPFNTVFLLSSMKKVQFDSILVFLKYLVFLISNEGHWSDGELSDETLIDWISVTLDAHFTQLILTPEAKDILVSLQSFVQQHIKFYSEVTEVNRVLQAMTKTTRTISKDVRTKEEGHYSVEFMEL